MTERKEPVERCGKVVAQVAGGGVLACDSMRGHTGLCTYTFPFQMTNGPISGPLCDNCGKDSRAHFCWRGTDYGGEISQYHPSELRGRSSLESKRFCIDHKDAADSEEICPCCEISHLAGQITESESENARLRELLGKFSPTFCMNTDGEKCYRCNKAGLAVLRRALNEARGAIRGEENV